MYVLRTVNRQFVLVYDTNYGVITLELVATIVTTYQSVPVTPASKQRNADFIPLRNETNVLNFRVLCSEIEVYL